MYRLASRRPAVDPAVDLLFLTHVSSGRGRDLEAWLTVGVFFPIFVLVAVLFGKEPLSKVWPVFFAIPVSLASVALRRVVGQRRLRLLTIERRDKEVRLRVERTGVDIRFPVTLRGEQHTHTDTRSESHALHLQVIGAEGRSVVFVEYRGRRQGRESGWLSDGVDRALPHEELDLAAEAGASIVELRDAIVKANANANAG